MTDITKLIEDSETKLVSIAGYKDNKLNNTSSGVIYIKDDVVYIISNEHLVSSDRFEATFSNGETLELNYVGKDGFTDITLFTCKPEFKVEKFDNADYLKLNKGEYVLAIGAPIGADYRGFDSFGIISGLNNIAYDLNGDGSLDFDISAIQTDLRINRGNSGGALINIEGKIVGLNSNKFSNYDYGVAISIDEVNRIIDRLIENKEINRVYLGIRIVNISNMSIYEKSYYGINLEQNEGVLVSSIEEESPAFELLNNNDIIYEINGKRINDQRRYFDVIYDLKSEDDVEIKFIRNNQNITISFKVK